VFKPLNAFLYISNIEEGKKLYSLFVKAYNEKKNMGVINSIIQLSIVIKKLFYYYNYSIGSNGKSIISKEYILTDINYSDGDVKSSVVIVEILTII